MSHFLVNRHREGGGGSNQQFIELFVPKKKEKKKSKDMVLIKSYAEWQNHCSFCAVVVVSVAREDQVRKRR